MGINNAWKELQEIEQKISLPALAVGTGFLGNSTGARGFRLGIDASGWMYRACSLHGNTESPELVALFSRCSRLFRLPFLIIFVFDGPERPGMKRGKIIRANDHWLTASFQRMLDGFGFRWFTARGEAEATLAEMTSHGVPVRIDAMLTDDSDSFVFGADIVLRIRSEDNECYEASRYSAFDISTILGLSREDFILIAILAGGDYSDGLAQCGFTTAVGLARAGLGRQLIAGLSGLSHTKSIQFLTTWREALRTELQTNNSGHLPHRYKQLAAAIPADFPDLNVINLYRYPVVSEISLPSLAFSPPRLDILARFAEDHFSWGSSIGILTHFADQLFAGLVIRELACKALAADGLVAAHHLPSLIKSVVGERQNKSTGYLAELRLMLDHDPTVLTSALQAIAGRRDPAHGVQAAIAAWLAKDLPKVRVWVSRSMVEHVYPEMVLDYVSAQALKPKRRNLKTSKTSVRPRIPPTKVGARDDGPIAGPLTLPVPVGHADRSHQDNRRGAHSGKTKSSRAHPEKRYTTMSVIHRGEEVLELITDSEGEL
ncbi:PIN domain-like protein [Mycena polygramma]|nr:PIN domain-like protein [Mycena polygramma]